MFVRKHQGSRHRDSTVYRDDANWVIFYHEKEGSLNAPLSVEDDDFHLISSSKAQRCLKICIVSRSNFSAYLLRLFLTSAKLLLQIDDVKLY